ncbi:MAG TPA: hypothetical protein VIK91_06220 [Nannocystis sp.]
MFKLSKQHLSRFAAASVRQFEDEMVRHLCERFPLLAAAMGPEALLALVQREIGRAALHGITMEKDVRRFIELGSVLAGELGEALAPPPDGAAPMTPADTLARLAELASQRLAQAADPDDPRSAEAASVLADAGPSGLEEPFSGKSPVGQAVMPCPGRTLRKRLCAFSM